jgi:hypothetical protein
MTDKRKPRGYYFDWEHRKYRSQISINGRRYHLGYFTNKVAARAAYNDATLLRVG